MKGFVFLSAILCEGSLKVKGTMGQIAVLLSVTEETPVGCERKVYKVHTISDRGLH